MSTHCYNRPTKADVEFFVSPSQKLDAGNFHSSLCNNMYLNISLQKYYTVYTRVQVEREYKSNPIFEAKNTTFLEKV